MYPTFHVYVYMNTNEIMLIVYISPKKLKYLNFFAPDCIFFF